MTAFHAAAFNLMYLGGDKRFAGPHWPALPTSKAWMSIGSIAVAGLYRVRKRKSMIGLMEGHNHGSYLGTMSGATWCGWSEAMLKLGSLPRYNTTAKMASWQVLETIRWRFWFARVFSHATTGGSYLHHNSGTSDRVKKNWTALQDCNSASDCYLLSTVVSGSGLLSQDWNVKPSRL